MRSTIQKLPAFALVCLLAILFVGCGGDDNPTDPGPPGGGGGGGDFDDFDEATAITQSQVAASEAVGLVQQMTALAGGLGKNADKDYEYGWNEETQRWEYLYDYEGEGYVYDYLYTVQYLGADGNPQQEPQGAVTIDHRMMGESSYHYEARASVFDYDWTYAYNTNITGIGGAVLTMTGDGGYELDYSGQSGSDSFSYQFGVDWETLPPGITQPVGGCPTGTVRYDFAPFYCLVVFDGSSMATSTLYRANGEPVPGSAESHPISCQVR